MAESEEISVAQEIERMAAAQPFVPFSIVMSSGNRYEIGPSDIVARGTSTIIVTLQSRGVHLLRQNQISEISQLEDAR